MWWLVLTLLQLSGCSLQYDWVRSSPFLHSTLRILVCSHPSFPCDGMILSAWALPSNKEELKCLEPAGVPLFCSLPALLAHRRGCEGRMQGLGVGSGRGDFFALKYKGLHPIEVRQEDVGCSSILSYYLEMEMLWIYAPVWEWLGKGGESSWIPCPRNILIILSIVITKLSRSILMVSVILLFIIASIFSAQEWEYCWLSNVSFFSSTPLKVCISCKTAANNWWV